MSTEARRASLPPRPPHAPRTAGNPGPFDPRTPLDDTASPQADRPASDDTGAADKDRAEARRPGPGSSGAWEAGTAAGDSTTTPGASADAPCADAARPERPHRPSGTDDGTSTVGPRRPVPDGTPRPAAPAEPTHRPTPPAAPDARRTGAVPAEPTYRPGTGGTDSAERPYPLVGDGPPAPGDTPQRPVPGARPRFPRIGADGPDRAAPPPRASARFPDAPPTVGRGVSAPPGVGQRVSQTPPAPSAPPRPAHRPRTETPSETTTRLRPVPAQPDPALSWSAPMSPGGVPGAGRPASVSFGEPERRPRPFARRTRGQVVAAAVCLVLGTGLIGGAVTGAWLADGPEGPGTRHAFAVAGDLWHEVPVDQLFPPTVQGRGAGPGEADRVWTRIAVAPDSGCKGAFDALLTRALAPVGCERLLRATYTDATQSHVTTVGLLFTEADAAGMGALARRFERERLDRRGDLMPLPYAAKDTAAEGFGPDQRASWAISVLTDAPVVVYAVSGWADGRTVDEPQPAEDAMRSGATTAPAQAGLGHEARGLADRFERALRQRAGTPTERPS
ncbi:hypothetical protein GCM10010287_58040 [Streptomyces variabilis]|uniref:Uncharacterized protein n=4 Tax=Streptomyces TaxID=1883 RepID=A0ABQ2U916_9ACTN|nr:hypothetical protein [Streptomyces variabilis]GGP59745.1 hypothetical protein GCM10010265_42210 [Streptomyces griseoincarnatus]GGT76033.1 hypothetical protein GCM10010287_58040 [Streptomyces variabilis]